MNVNFRKIKAIAVLGFCLGFFPLLNSGLKVEATNIEPFFYISILAPITTTGNQWVTLMVEQLPKIGIGINVYDLTTWSQISPRTWGYPGPFPIPSYSEGGFDILFLGYSWGLDWYPIGIYESPVINPNGFNFYMYDSLEMDWAIYNYTLSFDFEDQNYWGKQIQALLYEDLPQISIIYPLSLCPMDSNFTGWDGVLWAESYQSMENWSIPGQTEFYYASPATIDDFHIYKYESVYDAHWLSQIYTGLLERSPIAPYNNYFAPYLATNYVTTDGLVYNITLNPEVKFADGSTLNASDVKFSYDLVMDPDFGHPSYSYWSTYLYDNSTTILSEYEVQITFKEQYTFQDGNLALEILPKSIWEPILPENMSTQAFTWATTDPTKIMGTGPYYLYDYNSTTGVIQLKRNEYFADWALTTPFFESIYFEFYSNKETALAALASGAVDMIDSQFSTQLNEVPVNCSFELVDDPGSYEMAINMQHPILGTGEFCPIAGPESAKHIRKAISYMVPRDIIVDEILDGLGKPGVTACPPVATCYDESLKPYEYSQDLALYHLAQAGYDISAIPIQTGSSVVIGFSLPFLMGIIALIGGVIFLVKRHLERKNLCY